MRWRDLWGIVGNFACFGAAVILGLLPRRYWPHLERWVPLSRAALASALATVALAAAIGIPGFFRHAEENAGRAIDLTLQSTGWRTGRPGAPPTSPKVAAAMWESSFFSLFTFLLLTPTGLLCSYMGITGAVRAISIVADDPRGDPVLALADAGVRWIWRGVSSRRSARMRKRLEGAYVPDRLVTGPAIGFPDAEYVVIASRRKPEWEPGVFVVTPDKWYRLGVPVERQMAGGLRTLYPLMELRTHEVLRRGVPYVLPALSASAARDAQD